MGESRWGEIRARNRRLLGRSAPLTHCSARRRWLAVCQDGSGPASPASRQRVAASRARVRRCPGRSAPHTLHRRGGENHARVICDCRDEARLLHFAPLGAGGWPCVGPGAGRRLRESRRWVASRARDRQWPNRGWDEARPTQIAPLAGRVSARERECDCRIEVAGKAS